MELSSTGTFGCVVASNIIHHIPNPEAFILKMKKFVEPGGTFVLADFYRWEGHMAKVSQLEVLYVYSVIY